MSDTYNTWLSSTRTAYANAITNAYNNRETAGNDYYLAWQDLNSTSDLASVLPPSSTAFWNAGGGPTATEANIELLRDWLQANPATTGKLNLEVTLSFRDSARSDLGNAGNVGTEKRKWKGQPLYTFANGIVVGKETHVVAAIGTEGGEDLDGFGTDTLTYFDGVPFATGTGTPGTTVFRGDTVTSGSIRGSGGVVVIPDVIQLEQDDSITSPAGIGVDKDGKIRLRNRGEGFLDLVDEIDKAETDATNASKLFTANQNTNSGRWGSSLVPNSNFSYFSIDPTTFASTFANIISVGTTSNILSAPSDGVGQFTGNAGGICFQAIPVPSERYAIRIRFEGGTSETADNAAAPEGLFVAFHETTDDLPDGKYYIFNDANVGPNSGEYEGNEVHTANVTAVIPPHSEGGYATLDGGGNYDGLTISTSMSVSSFLYKPSAGAKNASMVVYARNYSDIIKIDYIVVTESPQTTTEIDDLITAGVGDITSETDLSIVPDKHMADKTQWATRGTGVTLVDSDDGGDPAEDAIEVTLANVGGGGIISSAIACESDRYLVGAKIKVTAAPSGSPQIQMFAIENLSPSFPTIGGASTSPITSGNEQPFDIMEVSADNSYSGTATSGVTIADDGEFHTLIGTYEATVTYMDSNGDTSETYDATKTPHPTTPVSIPSVFSLVIVADKDCTLLIDYVYARIQGSSVNIVEGLANQAYTDAHGFVTAMNELVIKESGSIITNSSMAILDDTGKPSGWRTTSDCTLTFDNTGDYAIQIEATDPNTRRLVTPTFSLGTADKFSIGVRIKGVSGSITPVIKVAFSSDSLVPTGFVTIADANGGQSDVYTTNTDETSALVISPTTAGTSYETVLTTWNRTNDVQQDFVGGMASIIIESTGDFVVDYVFVKEQTVSYDLADAQAESRRDEAIAQSEGYLTGLSETMAQESGSLMSNAGFGSWFLTGGTTGDQRPQGWYTTRNNSSSPLRVIAASEGTNSTGETVEDVNQTGSALKFSPGASGGILSPKFDLPISPAFGSEIDSSQEASGKYTLAIRVRLGSAEPVGIRLYAHEYYGFTDSSETHVICTDGTYGTSTYENTTKIKTFTEGSTTGGVGRIKIINFTTADTDVGYGADDYIEYLPVDDGDTQGDPDDVASNYATWYQIGGTYSPNASTKQVSFEIVVDGDPDSDVDDPTENANPNPNVYIDYVNLVAQPFDADFAQSLADSRIENQVGTFSGSGDYSGMTIAEALTQSITALQSVENDLAGEQQSTTIVPDSFFADNTGNTSNTWKPTRSTDGTVDVSSSGSHGQTNTYASLPAGTDHTVGMLSKTVERASLFSTGVNPFFNFVVRLRDQTDASGEQFSIVVVAHEWFSDTAPSTDWVYAEGVNFTLSSNATNVTRFTTGADGQTQILNGISATLIGTGAVAAEVSETQSAASWKTVAFEYEVHTSTKYVSFEIFINEDKDDTDADTSGDPDADILIDGVLLQQATDKTLVETLADTQILATDFTSGGALYGNSNNTSFKNLLDDLSSAGTDIVSIETNLGTVNTDIGTLTAAANETALVNEQIAGEVATLFANGGFSEGLEGKKHIPIGFVPHQNTDNFVRYQSTSDTTLTVIDGYDPSDGSQTSNDYAWDTKSVVEGYAQSDTGYTNISTAPYYDADGNGFGVAFGCRRNVARWATGSGMIGFYTKALSLPNLETITHTVTTQHSSTATSATTTEGARYTVAFRVKPLKQAQGFAIVAHEYDTDLTPSTDGGYISAIYGDLNNDGSLDSPTVETDGTTPYTLDMEYAYGGQTNFNTDTGMGSGYTATRNIILDVLKLSDSTDNSRQTFESVPADTWHTVGGTYQATGTAKCVSFSLLVRSNPTGTSIADWESAPAGITTTYSSHDTTGEGFITTLCDFAYMEAQLMNADMVENIAALRAADVQNSLNDDLSTLEGNLGSESDSLMPNGNFLASFTSNTWTFAKAWLPTGHNAASKLRLHDPSEEMKSIGTYVLFDKDVDGGSGLVYGPGKSGIISKAVLNPVDLVTNEAGYINSFNIGLRIRGTTLQTSTPPVWTEAMRYGEPSTTGAPNASMEVRNISTGEWLGWAKNSPGQPWGPAASAHNPDFSQYDWVSNGSLQQTWSQGGNTITGPTGLTPAKFIYAVEDSSVGNYKYISLQADNTNTYMAWDLHSGTTWQQQAIVFNASHTSSDENWSIRFIPYNGGTAVTTGFYTSLWYTNDAGVTWFHALDRAHNTTMCAIPQNRMYSPNGGHPMGSHAWMVLFTADPESGTAYLPQMDEIRVSTDDLTWYLWLARGAINYYTGPQDGTPNTPDFSIKVRAHESYKFLSGGNIIVYDSDSSELYINDEPDTSVGVSLESFSHSAVDSLMNPNEGQVSNLNLIDLRYSQSTPGEEITIDADVVDNDSGELITDWRNIVGSYTPNAQTTGVSFEVLIDHNKDNDETIQGVWLDSITMTATSINRDIAADVADNRIFVEQNFQGGSTPVSPNNVLKNADMSQAQQVASAFSQGEGDTLKRPVSWQYMTNNSSWDWSSTDFILSPASTETNRAYRILCKGNYDRNGITSAPFKLTSSKYKIRVVMKAEDSNVDKYKITAFCTNATLTNATAIINTGEGYAPYYYPDPGDSSLIETSGDYFNVQEIKIDGSVPTAIEVREIYWTPTVRTNSVKPRLNELPEYASLALIFTETGAEARWVDIYEFSCEPVGKQYGTLPSGGQVAYGQVTDFDDDGDVLPDAPRDIEEMDPLVNSIDVEIHDSTSKSLITNKLLMALPRKWFATNTGTDPSGTSYHYPGVSDLMYEQKEAKIMWLAWDVGSIGDTRCLVFPDNTNNTIRELSMITFKKGENPAGSVDRGWYNPDHLAQDEGAGIGTGTQVIEQLGSLWFDHEYEPGGWTGNEIDDGIIAGPLTWGNARPSSKADDPQYINSIGSAIYNVKSVYVGNEWNRNSIGAYAAPHWDGFTSILNRVGTTIGNQTTNGGSGSDVNFAKYNRMGGIYIKQKHDYGGLTLIQAGSITPSPNQANTPSEYSRRWTIHNDSATGGLIFSQADDESTEPAIKFWISTGGNAGTRENFYVGGNGANGNKQAIYRTSSGTDWYIGPSSTNHNHRYYMNYGSNQTLFISGIVNTEQGGEDMRGLIWMRDTTEDDWNRVRWLNFTGVHNCKTEFEYNLEEHVGLIVCSTGKYNNMFLKDSHPGVSVPTLDDAHPIVKLSSKRNEKSVLGVVSRPAIIDSEAKEYRLDMGAVTSFASSGNEEKENERIAINAIGEGGIWICNINGNLENGDYITTSEIPGIGMKQDDDLLHNYTVAKITEDCNFDFGDEPHRFCVEFEFEGQTYRKAFVGCTYHCG